MSFIANHFESSYLNAGDLIRCIAKKTLDFALHFPLQFFSLCYPRMKRLDL
jgi:hypothetical protein